MICMVSTFATYCAVRFCWQAGADRTRRRGNAPVASLLTVNTVGEAIDAVRLVGSHVFRLRYISLLAQCLTVCCFAAATVFCGPISRISTRVGEIVAEKEVSVYPAMRDFDIIAYANNYWQDIERSLHQAGFPYDRLLDFLPDVRTNWQYRPQEWTQAWSLNCTYVQRTPIVLDSTGQCRGETVPIEVPWKYEMMPQLYNVLDLSNFELYGEQWSGFWVSNINPVQDMLLFIYAHNINEQNMTTGQVSAMDMSIASVHLHNLYKNLSTPNDCSYAAGPIGAATYVRADCALRREQWLPDEHLLPYPEAIDAEFLIASAFNQNFQARFMMEAATNQTITQVTPEQLVRFYQVYMISKDTQYRQPVVRRLTVLQEVPQISSILLVIVLLIVVLCIIACATLVESRLTHGSTEGIPQSKVDWVLYVVNGGGLLQQSLYRREMDTVEQYDELSSQTDSSRTKFETAVFQGKLLSGPNVHSSAPFIESEFSCQR